MLTAVFERRHQLVTGHLWFVDRQWKRPVDPVIRRRKHDTTVAADFVEVGHGQAARRPRDIGPTRSVVRHRGISGAAERELGGALLEREVVRSTDGQRLREGLAKIVRMADHDCVRIHAAEQPVGAVAKKVITAPGPALALVVIAEDLAKFVAPLLVAFLRLRTGRMLDQPGLRIIHDINDVATIRAAQPV